LRRAEARFCLQVIGDDRCSGLERIASRRSNVGGETDDIDRVWIPADPSADDQAIFLRQILKNLCEARLQPLRAKLGRTLQDLLEIPSLHSNAAKLAEKGLLVQAIGEIVPVIDGSDGWFFLSF
jgi:hypothetical protein